MKFFGGFAIFILIFILFIIILLSLVMPSSLDEHLSQVISLVGVLTALVSIIWTQYNKSMEEKNRAYQFESEKKHQITKETYQKLFTQKVKIYTELHEELYKHEDNLLNIGREEIDVNDKGKLYNFIITDKDVFIKLFSSIDNIFKDNLFIISNNLEKEYRNIKLAYSKSEKIIDEYIMLSGDYEDDQGISKKQMDKFMNDYKEKIESLIKIIKEEIEIMKSDIWNT